MVMHGCLLAGLVLSLGVAASLAQEAAEAPQQTPNAAAQPAAPDVAQPGGDMGGFGPGGPGGFGAGGFGPGGPGGFGAGGFGPGGMDMGGYDAGGQDFVDPSQADGTYDNSADTGGGNQPGMQNRRGGRGGQGQGGGGRGGRGNNRNQPQDFQQGGGRRGGGGGPGGRNVTGSGIALTDFSRISTNWADFRSSVVVYNIFNPNRQGPIDPSTVAPVADSFSLVGIIDYRDGMKAGLAGTMAFFDGNKSEFVKTLKLNDSIASVYKVTRIDPAAGIVTLTSGLGSVDLNVGTQMYRPANGVWTGPIEGTGSYRGGGLSLSMDVGYGSTFGNPRGSTTTEGTLKLTTDEQDAVIKRLMQKRDSKD